MYIRTFHIGRSNSVKRAKKRERQRKSMAGKILLGLLKVISHRKSSKIPNTFQNVVHALDSFHIFKLIAGFFCNRIE